MVYYDLIAQTSVEGLHKAAYKYVHKINIVIEYICK
jgi:hypothetical protein